MLAADLMDATRTLGSTTGKQQEEVAQAPETTP
jgi:hypothetical protein